MSSPHIQATNYLPLQALESCLTMAELKQFHSQIIKLGLSTDNYVIGRVVKICSVSKKDSLIYALKVFDTIPKPDAFIYNTIMRGYLQRNLPRPCILLYSEMLQDFVLPNNFTFPCVLGACGDGYAIEEGRQIHAHTLKLGFGLDGFTQNSLIHMYMNFKSLEEAKKVFDKMLKRDVVSWTSLISGYAKWGFVDEALKVFELMPARRNSIVWNAMIAAYVQSNRFHEALALFQRMKEEDVVLDKYILASMLSACTGLGSLEQGKWIHCYIDKHGIELDSKLATSIIDMYCKCGYLEKAFHVFNGLDSRGISSWNCMIGGLAMHGKGRAAIELFKEMESEMVPPDNITFVNLLTACAHSCLIEKGRHYFQYMTKAHGIEPKIEHYGCMVDLLGRAGMLEEATKFIDEMPMSPNESVLGALLGACRIHKNSELGEKIGKRLIDLEPDNSGRYVLLSNIYANTGRWEDVAKVRKLMDERGVKKTPGFSIIELEGIVNEFTAGGRAHPEAKEIYAKVDEMLKYIRLFGYVPETEGVLHEAEQEESENPLNYHSEKLAMALGLLKTRPGETLRISKNLRVCKDCHQASKLISKAYNREIIVRDGNRFHHFKMGECSCADYW